MTLLLLLGVVVGLHGLQLVPEAIRDWFPVAAQFALSVVGFMLGERFLGKKLRETGRLVLSVSIAESVGAVVAVLVGLVAVGTPPVAAVLLAGISAASAPAATLEALGFVFLCGGLASLLGVSYLFACMVLGAAVANRAHHHTRPFHAIEGVSEPFLVMFFLLAGFQFDPSMFAAVGLTGAAYVIFRSVGKIVGAYAGAKLAGAPSSVSNYVGWCLLPQAGVALGLGLLAAERFPERGGAILSLLVGTTFLFEVAGPIVARVSLKRAGETPTS